MFLIIVKVSMFSLFDRFPQDNPDEPRRVSGIVLAAIRIGDVALRIAPMGDLQAAQEKFEADQVRLARIDAMISEIDEALEG